MNKKVKALLMTLKDRVTVFMIVVCLCYAFGNEVPLWLGIVAMIYCWVDVIIWLYKVNYRKACYDDK